MMDTDWIFRIDMTPFDEGVLAEEMDGHYFDHPERKVRFVLFLRYLDQFCRNNGVDIDVPEYLCVPKVDQEDINGGEISKYLHWTYSETKVRVLAELIPKLLSKCGWESFVIKNEWGTGKMYPYASRKITEKEADRRRDCVVKDPLFPRNSKYAHIFVCWNRRLWVYNRFTKRNPNLIKHEFEREDALIRRLLRKIADPLASEIGTRCAGFGKKDYQMAFFDGYMNDLHVTLLQMDYNFFIRVVILDKLITAAEGKFGYLAEKEAVA